MYSFVTGPSSWICKLYYAYAFYLQIYIIMLHFLLQHDYLYNIVCEHYIVEGLGHIPLISFFVLNCP